MLRLLLENERSYSTEEFRLLFIPRAAEKLPPQRSLSPPPLPIYQFLYLNKYSFTCFSNADNYFIEGFWVFFRVCGS